MTIPLPLLDLSDCDSRQPLRAFIGLWPDQATRDYLQTMAQRAHADYGGRAMLPEHFHLTLAFLDGSPVPALQDLAGQMASWRAPRIGFDLSVQDAFIKPRVVWAGPDETQQAALALLDDWHEQIWMRLEVLGWARTERRFRPHVSLLRHARLQVGMDYRQILPPQAFVADGAGLIVSIPVQGRSQYHLAAPLGAV